VVLLEQLGRGVHKQWPKTSFGAGQTRLLEYLRKSHGLIGTKNKIT